MRREGQELRRRVPVANRDRRVEILLGDDLREAAPRLLCDEAAEVERVLADGAEKARAEASVKMADVRRKVGVSL